METKNKSESESESFSSQLEGNQPSVDFTSSSSKSNTVQMTSGSFKIDITAFPFLKEVKEVKEEKKNLDEKAEEPEKRKSNKRKANQMMLSNLTSLYREKKDEIREKEIRDKDKIEKIIDKIKKSNTKSTTIDDTLSAESMELLKKAGFICREENTINPLVYTVEVDPSSFEEAETIMNDNASFLSYACKQRKDVTTISWA